MSVLGPNEVRDRDTRKLAVAAIARGWCLSFSGKHLRWQGPNGMLVFSSLSPSDTRSWKNLRSRLRRHGLEV